MKNYKKFLVCITALLVAALLFGCEMSSSKAYTYAVDTGDSIKVSLNTKDGYDLSSGDPFAISYNGEVLSQGTFMQAEAYEQFEDAVKNDENAQLLDSGVKDGNTYIFWSFNGVEFNYAILVGDSDTTVVLGNNVSEESAKECFARLTITAKQ